MFVRKKKNKSGSISVQIISKKSGKYKVVKTIGSSKCSKEIERLSVDANHLISIIKEQTLLELITVEDKRIERFVETLSNTHVGVIGPELIFGALFDRIGFNAVPGDLFRHLVITRLVYPGSKLKTVDYLQRYKGIDISVDRVYLFLDKLQSKYKSKIEKIAFEYTKKILKNIISVVFYDMTTLYFEAEAEDDLRKIGFSKDGKFQKPQIVLGLLVGEKGYPTNTRLSPKVVIENYNNLWQIEKAFRISKTDLKVRPIYYRLKDRIEAHICIAFAAYLIYKELERLLYNHKAMLTGQPVDLSVNRAIELTRNMYEMRYILPDSRREKAIYLKMDSDQQLLYDIIVNQ